MAVWTGRTKRGEFVVRSVCYLSYNPIDVFAAAAGVSTRGGSAAGQGRGGTEQERAGQCIVYVPRTTANSFTF